MPTLNDAILFAAAARPGDWTATSLALEIEPTETEIQAAIHRLRTAGHLQKRRGNPRWGGRDRLRASKAGRAALRARLRQRFSGEAAAG
jgi:DNA-binding transcriptional regulator PaaX